MGCEGQATDMSPIHPLLDQKTSSDQGIKDKYIIHTITRSHCSFLHQSIFQNTPVCVTITVLATCDSGLY